MNSRMLVVLAGIVTGAACASGDGGGGGGTGPDGPGEVNVRLTVPGGVVDGIALVQVTGGTVARVSNRGPQVRAVGVGGSTVHIIARGTLQGNVALAAVCIPQVEALSSYSVQVIQMAAGQVGGYARRNAGSYSAALDPASVTPVANC